MARRPRTTTSIDLHEGVERALESWRSTLALALLALVLGLISVAIADHQVDRVLWQNVQAILVGAVAVGVLFVPPRSHGVGRTTVVFVAVALSVLVLVTANQVLISRIGWPLPPLLGHKLGMIAIAILATSPWVGAVLIALYTGDAVVVHLWTDGGDLFRSEPWATIAVGVLALGLLRHRGRARGARRAILRAQATRAAAQRMARTLLAIRDLANTPLQTLTLTCELLAHRRPDDPLVLRMRRALVQLGRLNELIQVEEVELGREWRETDASFDAEKVIEGLRAPRDASG